MSNAKINISSDTDKAAKMNMMFALQLAQTGWIFNNLALDFQSCLIFLFCHFFPSCYKTKPLRSTHQCPWEEECFANPCVDLSDFSMLLDFSTYQENSLLRIVLSCTTCQWLQLDWGSSRSTSRFLTTAACAALLYAGNIKDLSSCYHY